VGVEEPQPERRFGVRRIAVPATPVSLGYFRALKCGIGRDKPGDDASVCFKAIEIRPSRATTELRKKTEMAPGRSGPEPSFGPGSDWIRPS